MSAARLTSLARPTASGSGGRSAGPASRVGAPGRPDPAGVEVGDFRTVRPYNAGLRTVAPSHPVLSPDVQEAVLP